MNQKRKDRQFSIPYPFKFIGLGIAVLAVLFLSAVKAMLIEISPENKELVKTCALNLFILGLFLIATAKEKLEDERSFYLKTKAFAGGFAGAIVYVIIKPFINLFGNSPMEVSGQEVALAMLFVHLITYYLQKITSEEA